MMKVSIYGKPELKGYATFKGSNNSTHIAEILYKTSEGGLIDIFMPVSVIQSFIDELQAKVDEEMEEKKMRKREELQQMKERFNGDFWRAVEALVVEQNWEMADFKGADIVEVFNDCFDNSVEENMDCLESILIKKAVEDAGMEYGTFDSGFMAPEWDGKWYKYGGWSKYGNDWIVCGNSLKEIQGQISELANG